MKKLLGAAVAATAVALSAAPTASATYADDNFVRILHEQGIGHIDGDYAMIEAGYEVCDNLDRGYPVMTVVDGVYGISSLNAWQSGYFVGASVGTYCPEYGYQIDQITQPVPPQLKYAL